MAFCSKCGAEVAVTAAFCGSCGAGLAVAEAKPLQEAASSAIPAQEVSEAWKLKFALLEKAGGPKLPRFRELTFGERIKASFNIWGFFFGPFYYLANGMWKKAIVLSALCIVIIVILEMILEAMGVANSEITGVIKYANYATPAVFASRANIDFYKKIVLNDNGWW